MFFQSLVAYVATALTFCVLDFLWLGFVAKSWYREWIGSLMLDPPRIGVGIVFYLVYIVGLLIFGVWPALKSGVWSDALKFGALYGFFVYFTYDMTNLATLKGWSTTMVFADIGWGIVVNALGALAGWYAASRFSA